MATVNNYGDVTVRGITYTGKGSDGSAAVSSWPITASSTYYYNWYTNTSAAGTVSEVSSSATALYLQHYVTVDGSMPLNPYRVGYYSTGAFGYVRDDAFPYGSNTIAYAANGGSSTPSSGTLTYGSTATAASAISRTGYTFAGWKSSKSGTTYGAGATIPTTEYTSYAWNASKPTLTMAAQWNINTYTVSYNANGGSGAPSAQTKTYNVTLTLSSTVPTRAGHEFLGWSTSSTATTATYSAGGSYTANAGAVLYAVWKINTYAIGYNANGGSGTISGQTKTYDTPLTLASSGYTRTGYTLTKWNTKADGSGDDYALGGSYTANAAATMYAVWAINTWTVSYNANGGSGTVSSQTKTYGTDLTLRSSGYTRSLYTLSGWNTASNGGGTSYALGGTYSANAAAIMYAVWTPIAPTAPTDVTNTRNSDTSNTIAWTNPSAVITTTTILRSVDGGSFATLTTITGSATSYTDTTTGANHAYAYKVTVANASGSATSAASGTTYNTPAAPTAISAARASETAVSITLTNPAITATALELERSADGSTWASAGTFSGSPVTSATDTPGGGTFYYRARNTRGSLVSGYSPVSAAVVTIVAPAAPTLTAPTSGAVISTATTPITFGWTHNPIDGSAQTAAQLRYSTDGGSTWTTADISGSDGTYTLANAFADATTVTWQARTKGAAASYGEWSASRTFTVYQQPAVSFVAPANGSTITNMPIAVTLAYSDGVNTQAACTLQVLSGSTVVYSESMGTATTGTIEVAEFLPTSGESYTLQAIVTSTSGLSATGTATVDVSFAEPYHGTATIEDDAETGTASVQVGIDADTGSVPAVSISVYRVTDAGTVLIASGLADGAVVTDYYAPLNTDYTYSIVTFSAAGALYTVSVANRLETNRFFAIWDGGASYAWGIWDASGSIAYSRPQKTQVTYAGRTYPVSYDGVQQDEQRSLTYRIIDAEERKALKALMDAGGRGVYKSIDGDVFPADFSVRLTPAYTAMSYYGTATLSIVRIDGEV